MKLALGWIVLLSSCAHPATPPAPPPSAPPPISAQVVSLRTGVGSQDAPGLQVVVSFHNNGADTCRVTSYALAWGPSSHAARQPCPHGVALDPNATAEATCVIPDSSPMRAEAARTEAGLEVVDVESTCQAAK